MVGKSVSYTGSQALVVPFLLVGKLDFCFLRSLFFVWKTVSLVTEFLFIALIIFSVADPDPGSSAFLLLDQVFP
jgi:hypothetical protein